MAANTAMKDAAGKTADKAEGIVNTVQQAASDAASYVGRQAGNLGSGVSGAVSDAADTVRDRVEGGYNYVRDQGVSGIADDMASMIRRNPVPSVLVALGLGFLMARAIRG